MAPTEQHGQLLQRPARWLRCDDTGASAEAWRGAAAVLLESYRAGTWVPEPMQRQLAEGLARSCWDAHVLRTARGDAAGAEGPRARTSR